MKKGDVLVFFKPAIPCAVLVNEELNCGKPANAGLCFPMSNGTYTLLPICKACSDKWYKLYFPNEETCDAQQGN